MPSREIYERALSGTLLGTFVVEDEQIAAMARVVGDGAIYCSIVDVTVRPSHQRKGWG